MCWAFLLPFALLAQLKYTNPVIAGDAPDPSLIRVDDQTRDRLHIDPYWAVTTGGDKNHAFPLYQSSNLIKWDPATTSTALNPAPAWTSGAYWAPEISEGPDRKFYIFYSALCAGPECPKIAAESKNPHCIGMAVADSPNGPYNAPDAPVVCDHWGSIDAMAYWDRRTAKQYLLWKEDDNFCDNLQPRPPDCPQTTLWAQEFVLDRNQPSGVKLLGKRTTALINDSRWEGEVVEGPFLLHHGDYFYLFYAGAVCCQWQGCNYAEGVARSRRPLGPYVKDPANPIMDSGLDNPHTPWKCPGHGSIVTLPDCQTFLLHHAYPKNNTADQRSAVLDEITWNNRGWPVIRGKAVAVEGTVPSPDSDHGHCVTAR